MPLVASYANNCPWAQIFCCHAAAKVRQVRGILETSLLKQCPCLLSGAKAFTFHLYMFIGRTLPVFYLDISRNQGHESRLTLIQVFTYG